MRARKRRTTDPEGLEWAAINLLLASDGWPDREIPGMLRWLRDKAGDPPMDLVLYDLLALCRRTNVIKIQRSRTAYVWGCNEKPSDVEHRAARDAYHQIIRLVAEPSFHHNAN